MKKTPKAERRRSLQVLLCGVVAALLVPSTSALGGELATLTTPLFTSLHNNTHRQNVCHRYDMFRAGQIQLRDALSGMALQPLMALGEFFNYDYDQGIPPDDPGLMAELMDSLAERANFTWRNSFAIMEAPEDLNRTWTNMLLWGIENYDVAVNWWDQSVERMEKGAAFIEPWFDGSVILIDQSDPPENVNTIHWFNWTSPFESAVWALTIFTILLSALVYQLIEFLNDEREDRRLWQWFSDNLYLSSLNFTQNFEYAPNSVAGRVFGVSMGMWALVMTATYTANLASLFVQEQRPALVVDSIDQAILLEFPICTWGLTNSDFLIQEKYPGAKRKPKATELEAYQALRRGECGLYTAYKDSWLGYEEMSQYNPECDLEWVGRVVTTIKSGFAVKADAGHLCSSLIRDVLNLHMTELISEEILEKLWTKHRSKTKDQDCETPELEEEERRRLLRGTGANKPQNGRKLKGGGRAAAASGSSSEGNSSLTLQQMMGTFAMHWVSMAVAITISLVANYYEKWRRRYEKGDELQRSESVVYRRHGPIVGSPPPVNTRSMSVRLGNMGTCSGEPGRSATRMVIRNMGSSRREVGNSPGLCRMGTNNTNLNRIKEHPSETTNSTAATSAEEAATKNAGLQVSNYDWSPELQSGNGQAIQAEPQHTPEWRRLYADMNQKQQHLSQQQHDLSLQMNSVLILLQEMRQEQQQYLQQSDPNGLVVTREAANKAALAGIDKHIADL